MDFSKITSDPELIKRLQQASKRNLTADEIQKQKASFVWGQMPHDHPMSKDEVADHLSGHAPYTPVTVSAKTKPTTATAISNRVRQDETIRDELWDGFNPFGSGPEPIGRREG